MLNGIPVGEFVIGIEHFSQPKTRHSHDLRGTVLRRITHMEAAILEKADGGDRFRIAFDIPAGIGAGEILHHEMMRIFVLEHRHAVERGAVVPAHDRARLALLAGRHECHGIAGARDVESRNPGTGQACNMRDVALVAEAKDRNLVGRDQLAIIGGNVL